MSANTAQKRYAAMNLGCPWRGLNVVPTASVDSTERPIVMFLYALPGTGAVEVAVINEFIQRWRRRGRR